MFVETRSNQVKKSGMAQLANYRVQPRGSFSAVESISDRTTLELYGSEGGFTRFFTGRRFDQAMVAFLGCVQELERYLQRRNPQVRLPWKIEQDRIGGFSVRLQFNQFDRWTKALKFLLTDLKWLIYFVEIRGG